ncbi:MAG: S-adenosylmethionine:tRNA ribosyltransferase-isomerase [Verrucomicrobia bacterium]|nr:S-adenosylmethionine:tRNA ribosyltransferase-isomerase [Verrucomicrobiota bacterium]
MLLWPDLPPIKSKRKKRPASVRQTSAFLLPSALNADRPAERRGLARDGVRLLVLERNSGYVSHTRFDCIASYLEPGDLLVFNSSRTLPATLVGRYEGSQTKIELRLAESLPDGSWLALLLPEPGTGAENLFAKPSILDFGEGLHCEVLEQDRHIPRLWKLRFSKSGIEFLDLVYRIGQPIRYRYLSAPWQLRYYQNVYALHPGSAEMPSAGRAFSWRLLLQLRNRGIESASITLHAGLSSYLDDEIDHQHLASEEEYWISEEAADKIRRAKTSGRRIVAIGTTVVRALESAASESGGEVRACHRYTRLRIAARFRLQVVNGLLTGLHEPEASHLDLLAAFVKPESIYAAYSEAIRQRYLWHEFGDLSLIL